MAYARARLPASVRADVVPDRKLYLAQGLVVPEALSRDAAAARNVEAVAIERVPKGAEEPLPLPRADPDPRELRAGGDGTPASDLPDDVEDELVNVRLVHEIPRFVYGAGGGGSDYNPAFV